MDPSIAYLVATMRYTFLRLQLAREDERGYSAEAVILTAVLAGLALAVGAIIVTKITNKANNIPTDSGGALP